MTNIVSPRNAIPVKIFLHFNLFLILQLVMTCMRNRGNADSVPELGNWPLLANYPTTGREGALLVISIQVFFLGGWGQWAKFKVHSTSIE